MAPVVIGAVGSERNLSFAVVGDTVNVASRLQALCRELQANICFGSRLIEAAKAESPTTQLNARDHGPVSIRGRDEPVHVWVEHKPKTGALLRFRRDVGRHVNACASAIGACPDARPESHHVSEAIAPAFAAAASVPALSSQVTAR